MSASMASLEAKLRAHSATVAIVGLGYAGLPMAIEIARAGFSVIGYDVDEGKISAVNAGKSPVSNIADDEIAPLRGDKFFATSDASALAKADVAIICVPTPLTADHKPDMRFVISAGKAIAQNLHPEMMVVLQSTCAPGTTTKLLLPELESVSGLKTGDDFLLVFAPERIDPGNTKFTVKNTPKLVGGTTDRATELAVLLYQSFIDEVIPVSSPDVAEMAKLVENTFRFINISFVNEMALLCDRLGVNVFEVIEAAKSKPFAFMPHYPSAGVGGHCIPVVPLYLGAAARDNGMITELIEASERINDSMPKMIVSKVEAALESRGKQILGANVLLIGMTYKADIADVRESASIRVLEEALSRGARAGFHDSLVPSLTVAGSTVKSVDLTAEQLKAADAVILLTPHTTVDYDLIVREASLVIDTRSGLNPVKASNVLNVWVPGAVPSALSTIA